MIYRKTGSNISLESAGFAGGRFVARDNGIVPMIHVTDHLGSVRAVVDGVSGEVVESNDYYPFGSRWDVATSLKDDTNRFRYNSKEEQFRFGTPYIDYGARQYDPVLGRWFAQDPLSEKYYGISPYAFCAGNPVKLVDEDGRIPTPVIGAIIGGGVAGVAAIIKGKSATEVLAATVGGAVDGAIFAAGGFLLGKVISNPIVVNSISGGIGGGVGSLVEQVFNMFLGNQEDVNMEDVGMSAVFGAVAGTIEGAAETVGKQIDNFYDSDETIKSVTKEIKDNSSKKMTNKKATNEAKKVIEEAKKNEKDLVENSSAVITNTWGFYYNIQDE